MSDWNHPICDACWVVLRGERRPVRVNEREGETCCWCGQSTLSGIYVRDYPDNPPKHQEHQP